MNTIDDLVKLAKNLRIRLNSLEALLTNYVNILTIPSVFEVDQVEYLVYDSLKVLLNDSKNKTVLVVKDNNFKCTRLEFLNNNMAIHCKNYLMRNISKKIEEFYELPNYSINMGNIFLIDLTINSAFIFADDKDDDDDDYDDDDDDDEDDEAEDESKEQDKEEDDKARIKRIRKQIKKLANDEDAFKTQMNTFIQCVLPQEEDQHVIETFKDLFTTEYIKYNDISADFMLWIYMDDMGKNPVDVKIIPTKDSVSKNEAMVHIKNLEIQLNHEYNKMVILIPCSMYAPPNLRTIETHPNE